MEKRLRVLQINSVCGVGSTGKIAEDLYWEYKKQGYECKVAWGRREGGTIPLHDRIKIGSKKDYLLHALEARLFDNCGFGSRAATRFFLKQVERFDPDIIHLHNLHGYYINISHLFSFLAESKKRVIWTLHDCWPLTGHCAYFDFINCHKWQSRCSSCPSIRSYPRSILMDRSTFNYETKKKLFTSVDNMVLVPVSEWLSNLLEKSYLRNIPKKVIYNGINTKIFRAMPSEIRTQYGIGEKKIILGVAYDWGKRKGLKDFIYLSEILPKEDYQVVLIGINAKQKRNLPNHIITLSKSDSQTDLAKWYTTADFFVNLTYEDNFPTVNLEAQACNTAVLTYRTGGAVESVPEENVVEQGDVLTIVKKIKEGHLKIISDWDSSKMTKQYIELINTSSSYV